MKDVVWLGSSKRDLVACAADVRYAAGRELERVQRGADPTEWKPMADVGRGVRGDPRPRRRRAPGVLRGDVP